MSLIFINSTPGMQIKRDMDFSNVMVQCDPRLLVPKNDTTRDSGLFKEDIAGKIGVSHDICDFDVRNLTVHGKLEFNGSALELCTITCSGNFSATATGTMTLNSAGILDIDTVGSANINIGTQSVAKTINIGVPVSNKVLISGVGSKITAGRSGIQLTSIDSGTITLEAATGGIILLPPFAVPTVSASAGVKGEIRLDDTFIYICISTGIWKRSPLSPF